MVLVSVAGPASASVARISTSSALVSAAPASQRQASRAVWNTVPQAPRSSRLPGRLAPTAWVLGQPNSPVDRSRAGCQASDGRRSVPTAGEAVAEP